MTPDPETLPLLATLAVFHLLAAVTPGPNFVVISYHAAGHSRRHGLLAVMGVVAATMVWVTACLAGVGILLVEAGWVYHLVRVAGAAYLVFMGARMVMGAARTVAGAAPVVAPAGPRRPARPFLGGLLTTFSNPKSAVFWTSLFAVAVPGDATIGFYAAVVAIVFVQSTVWYAGVALLLSSGPANRAYGHARRWIDGVTGTVMAGLGVKLAVDAVADAR